MSVTKSVFFALEKAVFPLTRLALLVLPRAISHLGTNCGEAEYEGTYTDRVS